MTIHLVLVTSLSHDPVTTPYARRGDAVADMSRVLVQGGWSKTDADRAAAAGTPVAIDDRGDDGTVSIRDLTIRD